MRLPTPLLLASALSLLPVGAALAATYGEGVWPEFTSLPATGMGSRDAALVVGVEYYDHYGELRGATVGARQWSRWLETIHGVPSDRLVTLTDSAATCTDIRSAAANAASRVDAGGVLWVVFIGRGTLAPSGSDALLLCADADPGADAVTAMGVGLSSLMDALDKGAQKRSLLVLDTAFVPPSPAPGAVVEPVVLQPGPSFQSRGSATALLASHTGRPLPHLPELRQPAFSYLLLGALRGWADADDNKRVTADEALLWVQQTLEVFHPQYAEAPAGWGAVEGVVISEAREFAPDRAEISWRAAERRIASRTHELDESEQMLRADASAVWQAVLGAYGMGGDDALASVEAFMDRWRLSSVKVDRMTRWLVVPELADAQALIDVARVDPLGEVEQRTIEGERYVQLQEEIGQFLRRNAWKGVEAAYQEMLSLGELGVPVLCEDHLHGARAARQLGNAAAVHQRLLLAVDAAPSEEAVQWLNDLEHNYGWVTVRIQGREPAPLKPSAMPFAPDRRAAVLFAQEQLEDNAGFEGLLPAGVYRIGGELLVVAPGDPPVSVTVQKARRNGRN
jgi:hypothetical protein